MRNYDLDFLKRFSLVMGFLMVVTLGLILLAHYLHGLIPEEVSPAAQQREQARIAPAGAVYAGATGAAAQAAATAAAQAAAASQVAYGGTLDGSVVFNNVYVDPDDVVPFQSAFERPTTVGPLAQILHAAIDTGIARAAFEDALTFVTRQTGLVEAANCRTRNSDV